MKVSILIAAHKPGAQIADALASARAQVHAEWELMVIDRSPPNENAAVVNDFAREVHARIEYEPLEEGAGSAAARNRLLELATGDAVAFLEPGDTWAPRHLATAVQFLSTDADVVVSDIRFFDRNSGHVVGELAMPAQLATNPIRALFGRETIASPSCVVVRRNIAERVNAFDPRYRVGEARDFWLHCALSRARFVITRRPTCLCAKPARDATHSALVAEDTVLFYEKHRDLAAVPAALRRRLLAASLVAHGRLLRNTDPDRAARCFMRAWSLQPVQVQTLGQFALGAPPTSASEPPFPPSTVGNETVSNGP